MLKSKTPEKVWEHINDDLGNLKIDTVIDSTLTKYFGIVGLNTSNREAYTKGMRIFNSSVITNNKSESKSKISVKDIIEKKLKTSGLAFEIFLQYFIEKYGNINIGLVPAELDYSHKVDCIIASGNTKFGLDIKIGNNGSGKRKKILEHARNIDNPDYIPLNILDGRNRRDFDESTVNINNYSNNFLYHTNGIIRVNGNSRITKQLKESNLLQNAYNSFIKNQGASDIETYIDHKLLEEFKFIGKAIPETIEQIIIFLKNSKKDIKYIKLNNNLGRIQIKYNSENKSIEATIIQGTQTRSYCDLFIPVTDKLLNNII